MIKREFKWNSAQLDHERYKVILEECDKLNTKVLAALDPNAVDVLNFHGILTTLYFNFGSYMKNKHTKEAYNKKYAEIKRLINEIKRVPSNKRAQTSAIPEFFELTNLLPEFYAELLHFKQIIGLGTPENEIDLTPDKAENTHE